MGNPPVRWRSGGGGETLGLAGGEGLASPLGPHCGSDSLGAMGAPGALLLWLQGCACRPNEMSCTFIHHQFLTLYSIACAYRPPPLGMAHTPSLPAMTAGERDGDSVTGKPVSLTEKPWKCSSFGGEVSFHNRHIALSELPVQLRGERKLQALVSELIH